MNGETRYARSGDVHVAYRTSGDAPLDLVIVPGIVSHVEFEEEIPTFAAFLDILHRFARVTRFDKRGNGLSDPVVGAPTMDERMDDIRAVMDAAGIERAALFGLSEGGPLSMLFAATYPERTSALVLWETFPRFVRGRGWLGLSEEDFAAMVDDWSQRWGDGSAGIGLNPSQQFTEREIADIARFERLSASPSTIRAQWKAIGEIDVRDVLSSITVPTLVMNHDSSPIPVFWAEYLAEHIPGAALRVLPGSAHTPWVENTAAILAEIEEFLTGQRHEVVDIDRVLATVLFTDIVGSTQRAVELGDQAWKKVLDEYHVRSRRLIEQYRGRLVNTTGDGTLATFDGPARAVKCAQALCATVGGLGIELRAGLHTGEIELRGDDVAGVAVHIGARVAGHADAGQVVVSSTVRDLVAGSGLEFTELGERDLKGIGPARLFAVTEQ
jgi:class 3 adenylate cyclase